MTDIEWENMMLKKQEEIERLKEEANGRLNYEQEDMRSFVKEFVFIGLPMIAIGVVIVCYLLDNMTKCQSV